MAATLRAIRGATTLDEDTSDQVRDRTQILVREMLSRNEVSSDDIVSIIFTATDDVHSAFPATAARALGLDDVPLLGAQELTIDKAVERCVRVMMHCYTELARSEIRHVYLEGAAVLRQDLTS